MLRPQSSFKQGIAKVQSLDFGAGMKKESDAHAYRMKLLEAQKKKKKQDQKPISKVGEDLRKKKEQQDSGGHGHGLPDSGEKASFGQCIFNMANILMGVGMLGLPYIFKSAGWFGGAFVTLFFSSVAYRTSILLGRELNGDARPIALFFDTKNAPSRMRKPINSFPAIAREAFGKCGTILLSSVLYFELFSCLAIFFVTLGDHLHTLFPQISVTQHMIHVSFALAVPTALLRTPTLLSYLSAVGTVATAGKCSVTLKQRLRPPLHSDFTDPYPFRLKKVSSPLSRVVQFTSGIFQNQSLKESILICQTLQLMNIGNHLGWQLLLDLSLTPSVVMPSFQVFTAP